jgi:uncharacterized protein (DUF488 family)
MPEPEPDVFTIGHSTHAIEDFVALLRGAGIDGVADVRRFPGSRRHPQFGSDALAASLAEAGIAYEHIAELGGRRARVEGSPNGGWTVAAFQGYADHLRTEEFARGLARLEGLAAARPTAVMCAEAQWWRCHRRLVADVLLVRGHAVRHVMPHGRLIEHALPDFAVVENGPLTYPPAQGSMPV